MDHGPYSDSSTIMGERQCKVHGLVVTQLSFGTPAGSIPASPTEQKRKQAHV